MTDFLSRHEIEKRAARLKEDVELDLRSEGIALTITKADPISKLVTATGSYPDYLLAKKLGAKKGWSIELAN